MASESERPAARWRPVDFAPLVDRLGEIRALLQQAAALAAAEDAERIAQLAETENLRRRSERGHPRRRYR